MTETHKCGSCGMPIDDGTYCHHCVDEKGDLQAFEERFVRMVQWMRREQPDATPEEAEKKTLAYMATMPAWKDHPKVKAAMG